MVKVKILKDDCSWIRGWIPRWKVGEVGELLENDSENYDYKVLLPGTDHIDDLFGKGPIDAIRIYYFYEGEIE
jgi:hypothetical protein